MPSKSPIWPDPRSVFLKQLCQAFRRRSKAIKYQALEWTIEKEVDHDQERLNFDFDIFGHFVRLSAWGDGALWFRCCAGGKQGWDVNYSFDAWADEATLLHLDNASDAIAKWSKFDAKFDKSNSS